MGLRNVENAQERRWKLYKQIQDNTVHKSHQVAKLDPNGTNGRGPKRSSRQSARFCLKVKQKKIAMCWAWLPSTESEWDHVWPYQPYATSLFFMLSTFQYILTKLFAPALLIKTKTNRCKQAFGSFAFLHEAHLEMKGSLRCPNWKQHHGFASCNVRTIRAHTEKLLGSPLMLYRIIHSLILLRWLDTWGSDQGGFAVKIFYFFWRFLSKFALCFVHFVVQLCLTFYFFIYHFQKKLKPKP